MKQLAVIDTNVIVSALISKREDSATVKLIAEIFGGHVILLYNQDILNEYDEVLHRAKFQLQDTTVRQFINAIQKFGIEVVPTQIGEILSDIDDLVFYEVTMTKRKDNAYLVTGNIKHFPQKHFIVTPAEFMQILEN